MHVIRLRRPWHKSIQEGAAPVRIDVPELDVQHSLHDESTFSYRRSFNLPSGLQASSRVYLRVDGWEGYLDSATLNGSALEVGRATKLNADITSLLESHNEIELRLASPPGQAARLSGEVTLAIDDGDDGDGG